jgi:hypothetical protein
MARTYLVGASIGVIVEDDGTVTFAVYYEDAAEDAAGEGATPEDVAAIRAALERGTTHTWH